MSDYGFKSYVCGLFQFKLSEEKRAEQMAHSGLTKFLTWAGFKEAQEGAIIYSVEVKEPISNPIHKDAKHFSSGKRNNGESNANTKTGPNDSFARASLLKGHGRS